MGTTLGQTHLQHSHLVSSLSCQGPTEQDAGVWRPGGSARHHQDLHTTALCERVCLWVRRCSLRFGCGERRDPWGFPLLTQSKAEPGTTTLTVFRAPSQGLTGATAPRGLLAWSADFFGCHSWEDATVSHGQRLGRPLNTLQCPGQPTTGASLSKLGAGPGWRSRLGGLPSALA